MKTQSTARHTAKQKRQAKHIEDSYHDHGSSTKKAEQIAWAMVNKQTGGAKRKKTGSE